MANLTSTLRIQLLDQVSGPSKGAAAAMKNLEGAISHLGKNGARGAKNLIGQLDHLRQKAGKIGEYNALRKGLANAGLEFRHLRENAKQLQSALNDTAKPTKKMQAEMRAAQNAVKKASNAFRDQRTAVREAEHALRAFGVNSRSEIVRSQQQVRSEIVKTIQKMRELDKESRKNRPKPGSSSGPSTWQIVGGAAGGYAVVKAADATVKLGMQGAHREAAINRIRNVSNDESEVEKAKEIASDVSRAYPYTTQEAALHDYVETRSIASTGDRNNPINFETMKRNQMTIARARSALASSGEDLSDEDVRSLMTALEGSGRAMDPNGLQNLMTAYVRGKQTFGTAISADKVRDLVANSKSSNFSISDPAFFENGMARLAQGNASRLGNEMSQTLSTLVGGHMTKQGAMWLVDRGLITEDQIVKGGGGKFSIKGSVKSQDLLSTDPTAWAQQVLLPSLQNSGVLNEDAIKQRMSVLRKGDPKGDPHTLEERAIHSLISDSLAKSGFRATVTDNLVHAIGNEVMIKRNVEQMKAAKGLDAADTLGQNPVAAFQEFMNSVSSFAGVLTGPAMQSAGQTLHSLADGISYFTSKLETWQKAHPTQSKVLGEGVLGGTAAAGTWTVWELYKKWFGGGKGSAAEDVLKNVEDVAPGAASGMGGSLLKGAGKGLLLGIIEQLAEEGIKYGLDKLNNKIYTPGELRKRDAYLNNMPTFPWQSGMPWMGPVDAPDVSTDPKTRFDQLGAYLNPTKPMHPDQILAGLAPAGDPAAGADAATKTMDGFNQTMQTKADDARAIMSKLMSDIQAIAATVIAPTIRPKVDMSAISGVHADIGVD